MRGLVVAVLVGIAASAGADELADADRAVEYRNVQLGAIGDVELGTSSGGVAILGKGGAEYTGIESFRSRRLLVQWDAMLGVRGGVIGNTLPPYTTLIGGQTIALVEAGYRAMHARDVSLYVGGRLSGDLSIMAHPGLSLSQLNRLNAMDSVGGLVAHGDLRVDLGVSWLHGKRSLLVVAFAQEAGYAPGVYTPGLSFTEAGIAARFDLERRFTASLEAFGGRGPARIDRALDTSVQSSIGGIDGYVRGIFKNGIWIAVYASYTRQFDQRVYFAPSTTYDTANAPNLSFELRLGIPFVWRRRSHS